MGGATTDVSDSEIAPSDRALAEADKVSCCEPTASVVHIAGGMLRAVKEVTEKPDNPAPCPRGPTGDTDRRAREALADGDRHVALTTLMEGYGDAIYSYCYRVLRSRATADDVYQTVFVQAYQHLPGFEGDSFRSWLYTIAHTRCLDALKTSRRWFSRFMLREELPDNPDPSPNSEERLTRGTVAAELEECLGKLKPHVRIAVMLRYQEGFSYEEMARICHERPATLQARVARALPQLRRCLMAKGVEP